MDIMKLPFPELLIPFAYTSTSSRSLSLNSNMNDEQCLHSLTPGNPLNSSIDEVACLYPSIHSYSTSLFLPLFGASLLICWLSVDCSLYCQERNNECTWFVVVGERKYSSMRKWCWWARHTMNGWFKWKMVKGGNYDGDDVGPSWCDNIVDAEKYPSYSSLFFL